MAANIISDAGLIGQGAHQAAMDEQNLAQQTQKTSEGAIGLGDLQRVNTEQAAQRTATQQAGSSLHDIAIAKADAAHQAGDSDAFQKYSSEAMQLPVTAMQNVSQLALSGADPQTIESSAEKIMGKGAMFDPGSLRVETRSDGHVIINATKNGVDHPAFDATAYYARSQKPVVLGKDASLVNPYSHETLSTNTVPEAAATGNSDVYMKTGPNAGKVVQAGGPRRIVSSITRTNTNPTASNPKDLPALKAIQDNVFKTPGMGTIDPKTGQLVGNQPAQEKAADAQRIYLNDRTMPPAEAANAVKFGKRATGPNGEKAYIYNGKFYKMANSGQQLQTQTTPPVSNDEVNDENSTDNSSNYARGGRVSSKGLG